MSRRSEEEYRRAALALASASRPWPLKAAMFSSATGGEGVTTAAVRIGRHLRSSSSMNPVVIELNRQKPAFSRLFGLDAARSMAALREEKVPVMECVQKDGTGLAMIPAGNTPEEFSLAGLEHTLCRVVQELQNHFDMILADAPPVLESADLMVAGRVIPRAVLVVGAGQASQESLTRACRELQDTRIEIAGTILVAKRKIMPRWVERWLSS